MLLYLYKEVLFMKKRVVSLLIASCFLLTLCLNLPVYASMNTIILSKTEFLINEPGEVTIHGVPKDMGAWVGIAKEGTRLENTEYRECIDCLPANNVWKFTAPWEFGTYEIRVFSTGSSEELYGKVKFTVGPSKAQAGDLHIFKAEVKLNEKVSVTINGLTKGELDAGAWAGIAKTGTKVENTEWGTSIQELPADNTWTFAAPWEFGKYEVRVFSNSGTQEQDLFGKVEFSVVSSKAREGDIKLSKTTVQSNEKVTVTVNGLTKGELDAGAWIGWSKVGSKLENTDYLMSINQFSAQNTWELTPYEVGTYELRIFCASNVSNEYAMFGKTTLTVANSTATPTNPSAPSNWAIPEIEKAKSENLVTDKVMVDFGKDLTREEFCELAVKLYERLSGETAQTVAVNPFKDTQNPEVLKAFHLGIYHFTSFEKPNPLIP